MNRMNPQVEIRISPYAQTFSLQEWGAVVKIEVQTFLEGINKPFCENEFTEALHKGPYWKLTLSGIDFKIKAG
jgi:hypothetical protein